MAGPRITSPGGDIVHDSADARLFPRNDVRPRPPDERAPVSARREGLRVSNGDLLEVLQSYDPAGVAVEFEKRMLAEKIRI